MPDASPDGSQTLQIHGMCLGTAATASGSGLELAYAGRGEHLHAVPSHGSSSISYLNSDWTTRPNGEILNTDANLCLADRGSSTAKGSKLFLEACDGDAGEIWGGGLTATAARRRSRLTR